MRCGYLPLSILAALGGTADVESIQLMLQEEEAKEKMFLEKLAQKLKDGGVSRGEFKMLCGTHSVFHELREFTTSFLLLACFL